MEAIVANLLGATALTLSLGGVANVPAPNGAHAAPTVTAQWPGYGYYGDGALELAQVGDGWVAGLGGPAVAQARAPALAALGATGLAQAGTVTLAGDRAPAPAKPRGPRAPADEFGEADLA